MNNENGGQEHNKRIKPQPLIDELACFDVTHNLEARLSVVHIAEYYRTPETMTDKPE
jgi:hypothetical protein